MHVACIHYLRVYTLCIRYTYMLCIVCIRYTSYILPTTTLAVPTHGVSESVSARNMHLLCMDTATGVYAMYTLHMHAMHAMHPLYQLYHITLPRYAALI